MAGLFELSMYGTREAVATWQAAVIQWMNELVWKTEKATATRLPHVLRKKQNLSLDRLHATFRFDMYVGFLFKVWFLKLFFTCCLCF